MKARMSEVPPALQGGFYGVAIAGGFWLLGLYFIVCTRLHLRVKDNEHKLQEQHLQKNSVTANDVWDSIQQSSALDRRVQAVDTLDLYRRLVGGGAVVSGVAGFIVLGFKEIYGFSVTQGTLAALLLELLPFISLASVLATLFVTFRAINLERWFAKSADIALPNNDPDMGQTP